MIQKKIKNQIDTKAGIAVRGAIGIDEIHPLEYVADLEVDCSKGNYFKIDLFGNIKLDCVNMLPGSYIFIIKQRSTGSWSITYSSRFKFINSGSGDLSLAINSVDILNCIYDGEYIYSSILLDFS